MAEICPSGTGESDGGDVAGEPVPIGSNLLLFNNLGFFLNNLTNYRVENAGGLTQVQSAETGMTPQGIALSPDKANLLLIGSGPSFSFNVAHYPLDVTGANVGRWSSEARRAYLGASQTGSSVQFSLLAPYFYFLDAANIWQNAYSVDLPPTALPTAGIPVIDLQYATPAPGLVLAIKKGTSLTSITALPQGSNGQLGAEYSAYIPTFPNAALAQPRFVPSKNWYFMGLGDKIHRFDLISGNLSLQASSSAELDQGTVVAMRYVPAVKRLFVFTQNGTLGFIYMLDINDNGQVAPFNSPKTQITDSTPIDMEVTPDGKFIYLPSTTSPKLHVFEVNDDSVTAKSPILLLDPGRYLQIIPIESSGRRFYRADGNSKIARE